MSLRSPGPLRRPADVVDGLGAAEETDLPLVRFEAHRVAKYLGHERRQAGGVGVTREVKHLRCPVTTAGSSEVETGQQFPAVPVTARQVSGPPCEDVGHVRGGSDVEEPGVRDSHDDLRHRLYHHLHRLSLKYYDTHQIGNMLSTITSD